MDDARQTFMSGRRIHNAVPALLYLGTGICTALPVGYVLLAAGSMYGPTSVWEYVSLCGSLALMASAALAGAQRKVAAGVALVGVMAICTFYLPTGAEIAKMRMSDQQINLSVLLRTPSSAPLEIKNWQLADESFAKSVTAQLRAAGVSGTLTVYSDNSRFGKGRLSHVTIVLEEPARKRILLREPDANDLIYVQHGDTFSIYPREARTLDRTISLEPLWDDPEETMIMVELSTGARQGLGVWFQTGLLRGAK